MEKTLRVCDVAGGFVGRNAAFGVGGSRVIIPGGRTHPPPAAAGAFCPEGFFGQDEHRRADPALGRARASGLYPLPAEFTQPLSEPLVAAAFGALLRKNQPYHTWTSRQTR
jgi:hypothetical protein